MKNLSAKCAVCYMCVCVWWEIVSHCLHMSFLRRHCCSFYWEQPIWLLSWWPPPIYAKVCSESTDDHLSSWKWKWETSRQKHHWLGCDSQLDNYRGCSRATWVRSWDVPPRLAGGLYELCVIHSPRACPPLRDAQEAPYPQFPAWIQRWHCPPTWKTSGLELLTYAQRPQSSIRRGMTLQTFSSQLDWKSRSLGHQADMWGTR